ncbi:MAG: cupin domain-containing protein [Methylococcales bacterium]
MNSETDHPTQSHDASLMAELDQVLFASLSPIQPPTDRTQVLTSRLKQRITKSIADHRGLLTIRHKDRPWFQIRQGIRAKVLWKGPAGNSVLIEFAPGASLPVHRHNWMEEGIVLKGGLYMDDLDLGNFDYHVSPQGSRHARIRSRQGALAYLRGTSIGDTPAALKELLGALLPFQRAQARSVFFDEIDWQRIAPGVFRKDLAIDGIWASRFVRMEPKASLAGHLHRHPEECMMLDGELFLGDILLRAGEYHIAASGSRHGEINTDSGAVAFVRGAVD